MKVKILVEKPKTVLNEYAEKDIKKIITTLEAALTLFGDTNMRCVYLLQAESKLRKLLDNMADSYM